MRSKTSHVEDGRDRISALSDPILHHIMSFLDMKEVIRTRRFSKRWISLWLSVPVLNFDLRFWNMPVGPYIDMDHQMYQKAFSTFVNLVLLNRPRNSDILRLRLSCYHYCEHGFKDWIKFALSRNAEELYIDYVRVLPDPDNIFTSGIKVFALRTFPSCVGIPQSINSASHLHTLQLYGATLSKNISNDEVEIRCPVLERLTVRNCRYLGDLIISAPLLKDLVVENKTSTLKRSCEIKISTPKLISLVLKGTLFKDYSLTNLGSLVNADVEFDETVDPQILIKILRALYNARTVKLSGQSQMFDDMVDQRLVHYPNLRMLKILGFSDGSCVDTVQNLLMSSPSIESLLFGINQVISKERNYTELFQSISCLKSVEIQDIVGNERELELVEFVLENAVALKAFTVTPNKTFWQNSWDEQATFNTRIYSVARVSSSVKILIRPFVLQKVQDPAHDDLLYDADAGHERFSVGSLPSFCRAQYSPTYSPTSLSTSTNYSPY